MTKPPSRRAFLKNGTGALLAGGVMVNTRLTEAARRVHLLWLGVGTREVEMIHRGLMAFEQALVHARVEHVFYQSPGTAHWLRWRGDSNDFAPRLLRTGGE